MIIFELDSKHALENYYVGRRVVGHESKGKSTFKGIIKSIDEESIYEGLKEENKLLKLEVLPDGKDKEVVITQDLLEWPPIGLILKEHIGTEQTIICSVTKSGKPYLKVKNIKFECPSCGTIISVMQLDKKLRNPKRCSCGRRGGFKEIKRDVIEGQDIRVLQKDTDFDFKAYIEGKEKIDLLKNIGDKNFIKITGRVEGEYPKESTVGDFVIYTYNIEEVVQERPAFLK